MRNWPLGVLGKCAALVVQRSVAEASPVVSAGVGYLRQVLDVTFFPELWDVRTEL